MRRSFDKDSFYGFSVPARCLGREDESRRSGLSRKENMGEESREESLSLRNRSRERNGLSRERASEREGN